MIRVQNDAHLCVQEEYSDKCHLSKAHTTALLVYLLHSMLSRCYKDRNSGVFSKLHEAS
jgi:hypothetical protein